MTAEPSPDQEAPQRPRRRRSSSQRNNVIIVALLAFGFGVFLHGCIALSLLDDDDAVIVDDSPSIVPVETATPVPVTPTATPLPDRTDCEEIRGTQYRSGSERDFFRANCLNAPEPTPEGPSPPLDGGTNATPTPEPG